MNQLDALSVIPETKRAAVQRALQDACNTAAPDSIDLLAGGLSSALVYKITAAGKFYVLRVVMRVDALSDPVRQFACMSAAAAAGIAPHVYHASAADGVAIMDYVAAKKLSEYSGSHQDLLREFAAIIRAIHGLPLFPKLVNYLDGVDLFIQQFHASGLIAKTATEEHFRYYAGIQRAYPRHDDDLVSSHNDLNPNNILFDGQRLWLIDWESAFQNDRYADLANVANTWVADAAQEEALLEAYFGDRLDNHKRARLFLMQQVVHMFYAMVMFKFAAAARPPGAAAETSIETPRFGEVRAQLVAGQVSLASYKGQLLWGKTLLNEILYNLKSPRFEESIASV